MTILVTGAAGFIGAATCHALLEKGNVVIGVDNLNGYYSPALKQARLDRLTSYENFEFHKIDIADAQALQTVVKPRDISIIIHLAAQAGVRYSLEAPFRYTESNVTGHLSVLELARQRRVSHMIYASSSSVYGRNSKTPFCEDDICDLPASLYGATKKADEMFASAYAHLYKVPLTGLRFFTVYGPWGRPDMAYWIFAKKMHQGDPITLFNHGNMSRDFTYIDDTVTGIVNALFLPPDETQQFHQLYNLGNDHPEPLSALVDGLESAFQCTARLEYADMQPGDVEKTWADITRARTDLKYAPKMSLNDGLRHFANWWRETATHSPHLLRE